jgi:hypothetical protein
VAQRICEEDAQLVKNLYGQENEGLVGLVAGTPASEWRRDGGRGCV